MSNVLKGFEYFKHLVLDVCGKRNLKKMKFMSSVEKIRSVWAAAWRLLAHLTREAKVYYCALSFMHPEF